MEVDPEKHLVTDAFSCATMFRGIEIILKGRDPRDAWLFAQRICGVCTVVHAMASIRAVENALDIRIPPTARLIRNIITATQFVHDHTIHFYHLHALDWVDITSALKADPAGTSTLAESISDWSPSGTAYFRGVQDRLKKFVGSGQLGPFSNAYWGHPAYKLPPEANLLAVAHYLEALEWQKDFVRIHAILGGKNPHLQSLIVGGVSTPVDPNSEDALNAGTIATIRDLAVKARDFVEKVYLPDLLAIASFYKEWGVIGRGVGNYLSYGEFPMSDNPRDVCIPAGIILEENLGEVHTVDQEKIAEYVTRSWFEYSGGDKEGRHPFKGETKPRYTGPKPPYKEIGTDGEYSWLKAPRYEGRVMEVGPLARMLVAYASGHERVKGLVDGALKTLDVPADALFSTLGRTLARGVETVVLAEKIIDWTDELAVNMGRGETQIHAGERWDPSEWPAEAMGYGLHEAPRGALGHWIHIKDRSIHNYQCVVPSTWNLGPRDDREQIGPVEKALIGTPVADPAQPLEILRTVHSFDPCMACGVHLYDTRGKELNFVKVG
ncbi:MAG: nickel-dependent hydrogenase large subunit [Candidatus Brocadiales bacterium]